MKSLFIKSEQDQTVRPTLVEVHIADIHFGVIDPKVEYDILIEQFVSKILPLAYDIISINGDLFHHKTMANSDAVSYAVQFIDTLVRDAKSKNATIVIIHGTREHDANQLKLFYHYLRDSELDIRIIEYAQFIYIKSAKILCIPEEYGKGAKYYRDLLFNSGYYDSVFMHGTIKGAIYGANEENLDSEKSPVFTLDSFAYCYGPIVSGHVHVAGCFNSYMYYSGSPIRWQYGEEQPKGFIILLHNLQTHEHYTHFEEITSFRYETFNLDSMLNDDPKNVINHIRQIQNNGVDHVRIEFSHSNENIKIISSYFANNASVKINAENDEIKKAIEENNDVMEKYKDYDYILDPKLSEYEILTKYINQNKGHVYLTVEELIDFLKSE